MKSITITARGVGEKELEEFNNLLNQKALEKNCTKAEALPLVLDDMRGTGGADSGKIQELTKAKMEAEKQLENVQLAYKQLHEEMQKEIALNVEKIETAKRLSDIVARQETELKALREQRAGDAESVEELHNAIAWIFPPRMGAIVLALIQDETTWPDIKTTEDACNLLLQPYWKSGRLVPDDSDIENYKNALKYGLGKAE